MCLVCMASHFAFQYQRKILKVHNFRLMKEIWGYGHADYLFAQFYFNIACRNMKRKPSVLSRKYCLSLENINFIMKKRRKIFPF